MNDTTHYLGFTWQWLVHGNKEETEQFTKAIKKRKYSNYWSRNSDFEIIKNLNPTISKSSVSRIPHSPDSLPLDACLVINMRRVAIQRSSHLIQGFFWPWICVSCIKKLDPCIRKRLHDKVTPCLRFVVSSPRVIIVLWCYDIFLNFWGAPRFHVEPIFDVIWCHFTSIAGLLTCQIAMRNAFWESHPRKQPNDEFNSLFSQVQKWQSYFVSELASSKWQFLSSNNFVVNT